MAMKSRYRSRKGRDVSVTMTRSRSLHSSASPRAAEPNTIAFLRGRVGAELPGIGFRMTVFGSRARGDAEPDSDMDVLVELDVEHLSFADKRRLRRVATEVSIASGIIVSLLVVDRGIITERG